MSASLPPPPAGPPTADGRHRLSTTLITELRFYLDRLARRCHADLDGPDGVGVTMLVEGRSVFAGSNPFTEAVDQIQYSLLQGPCLSAVDSEEVVRSRSIGGDESRWDRFTPRSAALELRSVISVPVRFDREVIGSLNLYGRDATTFDATGTAALLRHAELVGRTMQTASLAAVAAASAEILEAGARDREDIDIAVGLLMDRYAMTASQARVLVGQLAVQDEVSEVDAARSLIDPTGGAGG